MSQKESVARYYLYHGQKVGIIYSVDVPEELEGAIVKTGGNKCLLPIDLLIEAGLESERTEEDSWCEADEDCGQEIDFADIANPSNEQRLTPVWDTVENLKRDELVRRFKTFTDRYYDWTSDASDFARKVSDIDDGDDRDERLEELRKGWNDLLSREVPETLDREEVAYDFKDILKKVSVQ